MSAKTVCTSALVVALLSVLPARGQETAPPTPMPASAMLVGAQPEIIPASAGLSSAQPEQIPTQPQVAPGGDDTQTDGGPANGQPAPSPGANARPGLSDWITYNRPGATPPVGNALPLMHELFLRSGVEVPLPNTVVGKNLLTGWEIGGGGRLLLFNPQATAAWTAEVGMVTMENFHNSRGMQFPLSVVNTGTRINFGQNGLPGLTIKDLNRTFVNLGGGREWYVLGTAIDPGRKLRIGIDGGGRWGSAKMDFQTYPHRTDTIGGLYTALHADLEIPFAGTCAFITGLRTEWDYTFMDILQRKSDVMGINALATFGIRW